jgi:hypothetical protein
VRFLRENPCATLLAVQLLGVLLYPFVEDTVAGRSLLAVFGLVVLGLVIVAVRATPMLTWVAVTMALPAVVLLFVVVVLDNSALVPWASGFEAAVYFYAGVSMLIYMLADDDVTIDEYFALGAAFTLFAWGFAHVFVVVQALEPGSFIANANPGDPRSWTELLFLSFSTLSATGLSDVIPVRGHARSVDMIEQVVGVFYLAMVVTRLVALAARRGTIRGDGRAS